MSLRVQHIALVIVLAACVLVACSHGPSMPDRGRLDRLDSAYQQVASVDRMVQIVDSVERDGDQPALMLALKQLGKLYRNNSRFQDAIDVHNREFDLACRLKDTVEITRALNNLGTNFRRMGILEEATGYHYQALSYCDMYGRQDDPVMLKNRVVSLNGIGNIYMTMGNYQAADSVLRAALDGERQLQSELGQAINLANIGSILEHQGHTDSAWVYYRQSLAMNQRAGSELGIALCHTHFGELHEKAGDYDRAIDEYRQAYDIMRGSSDSWHWMESCAALARVSISRGDYAQASRYISLTDSIATAINSLEHQGLANQLKYQLALRQGDSNKALQYFRQADAIEDSVRATGNSSKIQNARVAYERQRRQAEFDLINRNYENERKLNFIVTFTAVVIVLLAVLSIVFLVYTLKSRRRAERLREQLVQMRANFFTNVTHEFRTPLTVIMGLSDQLQRPAASPEQVVQQATIINRQSNNLLQLINQLLDISRVDNEIGAADWRTGNLVPYLSMIVEAYQVLAQQQGITLHFAAQRQDITMDFAPYYMRRIVNNLVGNAIKFTGQGGVINVTCGLQGDDHVQLIVADNGQGIDPADLPHIFEPFYMGRAVSHGDMSTGVGLSLVNQIVSAMQGSIVVHSDQGKGTVFTVTLPRQHGPGGWTPLDDSVAAPAPVSSVETVLADTVPDDDDTCRILIVEDHNDVAYYIGEQLRAQYGVYYASNGDEALVKAEQLVPDLVITDLMMPGIDGYELCARIRQHPVLNHVPVIMVTARCTDEDRIRGYERGADAYLEKPFNPDELRMRVATLLEQRRQLHRHFLQQLSIATLQSEAPQHPVDEGAHQSGDRVAGAQPQDGAVPEAAGKSAPDLRAITPGEQQFMTRLLQLVEQAMASHHVDLEQMASSLAMTSTQLRRKVHAITGKTPINYVNELRMQRAAQLLHDLDLNVGDVADRCGYDDMAYFSRQFKQFHGVTPSQYRAGIKG